MIVYLDPEDYEQEAKEKKMMRRDQSPDRLAMKTTANFFRRRNVRHEDNEV